MMYMTLGTLFFNVHTYKNMYPNMCFAKESSCSKEIVLNQSCKELWFVKKCQNRTFKVNFLCQKLTEFFQKQAWKLSAIKGEPNLSILWEVRQIHLKKAFSSQKATSNLTKLFLDEKQFLQKSHYCQKAISGKKFDFGQIWSKKNPK